MIKIEVTLRHIAYQHFHQRQLHFLDCYQHILLLLVQWHPANIVEPVRLSCKRWNIEIEVNHLWKPKCLIIPHFVLSNHLFQCWKVKYISIEHRKDYTPRIILKTWSNILCFHQIIMIATPWALLFNRYLILTLVTFGYVWWSCVSNKIFGEFSGATAWRKCYCNTVYFT